MCIDVSVESAVSVFKVKKILRGPQDFNSVPFIVLLN
jgi:hypothetical protein